MILTKPPGDQPRFQECPWYVKLWRYRWYLLVPFYALNLRFTPWVWNSKSDRVHVIEFSDWEEAWSIAVGDAHYKMNWYYTLDEVFGANLFLPKEASSIKPPFQD